METVLQRLTDLEEIHNAILVGKDGLMVAGILRSEDEETIGAMSAAAFGSLNTYTGQISSGDVRHVILETSKGVIQMEETGDLVLIVLTRSPSNLGRVRLEMKKVCKQLSEMVASY